MKKNAAARSQPRTWPAWIFLGLSAAATAAHRLDVWAGIAIAAASLFAFALYGLDKAAARAGRQRLPEAWLLLCGLAGGWPGALIAQAFFRHKTRKPSFQLAFWLTALLNLAACSLLLLRATAA